MWFGLTQTSSIDVGRYLNPIGSMYGIEVTYIYHKNQPNVNVPVAGFKGKVDGN